jgi:hypothetical protein
MRGAASACLSAQLPGLAGEAPRDVKEPRERGRRNAAIW